MALMTQIRDLYLQNNCIEAKQPPPSVIWVSHPLQRLPFVFGVLTTLSRLDVHQNPLGIPPPSVMAQGVDVALKFLRR